MIVAYWNVKSGTNASTQKALKSLCGKYKPDIVCLSERMVDLHAIHSFN